MMFINASIGFLISFVFAVPLWALCKETKCSERLLEKRMIHMSQPAQYHGFSVLVFSVIVSFAFLERYGVFLLVAVGCVFWAVEHAFPDQKLPAVRHWHIRVVLVNLSQLAITRIGTHTWEKWAQGWSLMNLGAITCPLIGGFVCYMCVTFVFYWWHRLRHESEFLWVVLHQLHHSAGRIETLTSFYKSPYEIVADSVIISLLHYTVLGLGEEHMLYTAAFSVYGEFFYHMNIRTPRWVGYWFQRPESHRLHHARDSQFLSKNYADLPLWDILFGTFENPPHSVRWDNMNIGFPEEDETRVGDMLLWRNVRKPGTTWSKFALYSYRWSLLGRRQLRNPGPQILEPVDVSVRDTLMFWAWFLMAVGYMVSGIDKLSCESWRDGTALLHVLDNPLARLSILREGLKACPVLLQLATWSSLALELSFAPLCLWPCTRRVVSLLMILMHLSVMCLLDFADLTLGVLFIHLYTIPTVLDTNWELRYGDLGFRTFRTILGTYLFVHFRHLEMYAPYLWSTDGMLPDTGILPTRVFPNLLAAADPCQTTWFLRTLAVISLALVFQIEQGRSIICVLLWYGWACLWNRNILISNPGIQYVGWLLLACALWQGRDTNLPCIWTRWRLARLALTNLLGVVGCIGMVFWFLGLPQGFSAMTVASPLPLVFSKFNGHETFSSTFHYSAATVSGRVLSGTVGPAEYSLLSGPYNYRNALGVVFSHGPFFNQPYQLEMRRLVHQFAFCNPGVLRHLIDDDFLESINITTRSRPPVSESLQVINCRQQTTSDMLTSH